MAQDVACSAVTDSDRLAWLTFVNFLRGCTEADFRAAIESAMNMRSATSVWARLFGIGIERPGVADDLLWPVASSVGVLERIAPIRSHVLKATLGGCHGATGMSGSMRLRV